MGLSNTPLRFTRLVAVTVLPAFLLLPGCGAGDGGADRAPPAGTTVFEGARLIVGDGREPIEDGAFVVADGRLAWVGRRTDLDVPSGADRVDLTGRTVMPAIINTHLHLASERERLVGQLREHARFGTAVTVSLGNQSGTVPFEVRDEDIPGAARALSAGPGITSPEPGRSEIPYWVTDEASAREAVREHAEIGVDLVKIWVDDRDGQYEKLSRDVYRAIIEEAHRHDLKVFAHIHALDDAKDLLLAGVDAFAHGVRDRDVDDEFIALLRERPHVVVIPNLPSRGIAEDFGWLRGAVPEDELQRLQDGSRDDQDAQARFAIQARNLARLNEAGVPIAFGTDGSTPWRAHPQMEDMVASGMTPGEVIVAATRTSAELMGLTDTGTLQAGKSADFIVLEANPLDDIANTRRITAVYLRGTNVEGAGASGGN